MDEAAAAATRADGADDEPFRGYGASESSGSQSAEDQEERVRVFCCEDCGEAYREEAAYLEHRQLHRHESFGVHLHDQLDGLHDAEKDGETTDFCNLCSLSFAEPSEFYSHMERNHTQVFQKEPCIRMISGSSKHHTYECPDCGKSYGVLGHFLNHQRSHMQASKSVFHDLEHLKKKSFQCESCGRNYSRASALDAHRRCHEEKLVKSRNRSSGESFPSEESIVEAKPCENQTDDSPPKLFKCSCGKAFSALFRLKTHQRFSRNSQCSPEELNEKPKKSCNEFYCSECKKPFNGYIALFNHQKWHANHSDDSAKRFPCDECGKVFMTQTFYYRHQRTAHSGETPAKSFLHQVCQLQKKAFECNDCGLKFSRASALHSHQLHHTDVFRETEKMGQRHTPQQETFEGERRETKTSEEQVGAENDFLSNMAQEAFPINENDEEMESYEPGDFNVQVISASESEDEPIQDPNPDLELLCESDQEGRDNGEMDLSPSRLVSKPEMDLKIIQIDFEPAEEQCTRFVTEAENKTITERFDCPQCYRWFSSASSLRAHKMWHGMHKSRQTQGQPVTAHTCPTRSHEPCSHAHKDQNTSSEALHQADGLEERRLSCEKCGKSFSHLSALVSHQLHHPNRKQFQCPDCMITYSHAASLINHMNNCSAQKKENMSVTKKEHNPKKSLLGPKIYHCEQCGKGFWSLGAYSHHKQSPSLCADLRLRKGVAGSFHGSSRPTVKVACPVCGRKFRHRGIMALHMRKHENGNHKCELCNRSFRLFSSLLRHQVVHNEQLLPPPIKSFQHQVEQVKKNTYSCPDCGKLFSRAKALQFHMKSHGYETGISTSSSRSSVTLADLQCSTCLAHFNSKASLRAHQKLCIKRGTRCVPKDNTDVSSARSSELLTVHPEVKNDVDMGELQIDDDAAECNLEKTDAPYLKYKCKKCDRSFSVIGALNLHKRVHAKGYKSLAKVKSAMIPVLKQPEEEDSSEGLFHCADCGRRFVSSSALGSHKRWHSEKKCSPSLLKEQCFRQGALQDHQCLTTPEPAPDVTVGNNCTLNDAEFSCLEDDKTFVCGSLVATQYENVAELHRDGSQLKSVDQTTEQVDVDHSGSESIPSKLKPKTHPCPLCSLVFTKIRGLRAHTWQAHSKSTKGKNKVLFGAQKFLSSEEIKTEDASAVSNDRAVSSVVAAKKNGPIGRGQKKIKLDPVPAKSMSCLNCGKQFNAVVPFLDHEKICQNVKHRVKQEVHTPEASAEVSPLLSRLSEHTAKCLFKCGECGKAFQTEEQLGTHKTKAKSRPYCCALCCHGFWTENQLQQHLAWHDEVRCRLPNEVRFRLSASMSTKPLKPNIPSVDNRDKSFPSSTPNRPPLNPESQSQSSHKCRHCGKAFLSPAALQNHATQHCNSDSYHCSVCPRTFSEIQDLIDHHQECFGDHKRQSDAPAALSPGDTNGLTCLECGTTFCEETDLHQHYTEHAQGLY